MARPTTSEALVRFLDPVVAAVGSFEVRVHLSRNLLAFKLARFRRGAPLVEVELDGQDLKLHVADAGSIRQGEASLCVREFMSALSELLEPKDEGVIYYSTSITLADHTLTLNIPTRSLFIRFRPRSSQMLLVLREYRAKRQSA